MTFPVAARGRYDLLNIVMDLVRVGLLIGHLNFEAHWTIYMVVISISCFLNHQDSPS